MAFCVQTALNTLYWVEQEGGGGDLSIKALVGMYVLVSNIWLVGGDSFQREICFTNRMLPFV